MEGNMNPPGQYGMCCNWRFLWVKETLSIDELLPLLKAEVIRKRISYSWHRGDGHSILLSASVPLFLLKHHLGWILGKTSPKEQ